MAFLTSLFWASGCDPRSVFYTYPDLTPLQEQVLVVLNNCIIEFKSQGDIFATI